MLCKSQNKKKPPFWIFVALGFLAIGTDLPTSLSAVPQRKEAVSTSDARLLWNEANQAFEKSSFDLAKNLYEKLISNHPASPFFTEANYRLGLTLLRLEKPKAALSPLRVAVLAWGDSTKSLDARASLTEAYLENGLPHEAILLARESLKAGEKSVKKTELQRRSRLQLLEAQSSLELGNFAEAGRLLKKSETASEHAEANDQGRLYWLKVALVSRSCFAKTGRKNTESALLEQTREESRCIQQTLDDFLRVPNTELSDTQWVRSAFREIRQGIKIYVNHCQSQPLPPSRSVSQTELRQYQKELSLELRRECSDQLGRMQTTLSELPPLAKTQVSIRDLSREITSQLSILEDRK